MNLDYFFNLHQNIALQFSGGKDSLATLYYLRKYWPRLTVYWLDTGDAFPEVRELMGEVAAMVPRFIAVPGQAQAIRGRAGWPVDVLPVRNTRRGRLIEGEALPLQSRYSCCEHTIQIPMQKRMEADGITLIIRGQKNSDKLKGPLKSGTIMGGMQFLYPIEQWTDEDVFDFLNSIKVKIPRFYELMPATPDCMGCTAYLHENRGAYLYKYHPEEYRKFTTRLERIRVAIEEGLKPLNKEL